MNLLKASANHLISCPADVWLATYTKYTDIKEWSAVEWGALLNHVQKTLEEKKVLDALGWKSIRDLASNETCDGPAFQSIANIAETVREAAITFQPTLQRTTVVKCGSEVPGLSAKVHFLLARPERTPLQTIDTAVTTQFKLKDSQKTCEQNEAHLLSNVHYILSNDPRRRFTFGLTIEGDTMRLWHFSRSHIAVTDDLDYHKHPERFIHFLLFILFAPATALGFDPTVQRILDEQNDIAYLYEVGGSWYQTVGTPLSGQSRPRIVHGATRVWEVRKVLALDSDGNRRLDENIVVLKDVWPSDDTQGEKEIQDAIFTNLRKLDEGKPESGTPESLAEKAKRYFVTILEDEFVQVRGRNDTTPGSPELYRPAQFTHFWAQSGYLTKYTERRRTIRHRTHRRVIFKERCDTIPNLYDFRELLQCLSHNIEGLWYMRLAGYVHRDISSGNCMWYRAEGQGKISDLEFAVPYDLLTQDEPRKGTPQFMAVESQYRAYVLLPDEVPDGELDDLVFTFNFLHDLESILWILVWFLFYRIPDPLVEQLSTLDGLEGAQRDSNPSHDPMTEAQLSTLRAQHDTIEETSRALFDCSLTGTSERSTFIKSGDYRAIRRTLKPLYPDCFPLTEGINFVAKLNEAYKTLEASPPAINSRGIPQWKMVMFTYTPYEQFRQVLHEVLEYIDQSGKTAITPLHVLLPPATQVATKSRQKRSRDTVHTSSTLESDRPLPKKVKT